MGRDRVFGFLAVTAVAILAGQGVAAAQAESAPANPAGTSVEAGMTKQVNLTPAEQVAQADVTLARMAATRSAISKDLASARADRDVVKTLCLDDKLNQVDVAIRSAKERGNALKGAASSNDKDLASHEFTIISVLGDRGQQLKAEAAQCIGQEAGFIGESAVTSTVDPNMPVEDPSQYPSTVTFLQTPLCASCFQ